MSNVEPVQVIAATAMVSSAAPPSIPAAVFETTRRSAEDFVADAVAAADPLFSVRFDHQSASEPCQFFRPHPSITDLLDPLPVALPIVLLGIDDAAADDGDDDDVPFVATAPTNASFRYALVVSPSNTHINPPMT
jgi:hypothetical protein